MILECPGRPTYQSARMVQKIATARRSAPRRRNVRRVGARPWIGPGGSDQEERALPLQLAGDRAAIRRRCLAPRPRGRGNEGEAGGRPSIDPHRQALRPVLPGSGQSGAILRFSFASLRTRLGMRWFLQIATARRSAPRPRNARRVGARPASCSRLPVPCSLFPAPCSPERKSSAADGEASISIGTAGFDPTGPIGPEPPQAARGASTDEVRAQLNPRQKSPAKNFAEPQ